ncbi:MAG TPA: hypothetical protein VEB22_12855 [Phycisphaerales bacterium]|nr:hypothetical protein [Phycisphaerales bacterium]
MPEPRSVRGDALRARLRRLERDVAESGTTASESATTTTTLTDGTPRWVRYTVAYTDFTAVATTSDKVIDNLPAGTVCTHQRIEPGNSFVSPNAEVWRLSVVKSGAIYSAGGTAKTVDVTTPDGTDAQHAAEFIVSGDASANDWTVRVATGGTDTADTLSAGTATVHLLVSVPGSTANLLPHE